MATRKTKGRGAPGKAKSKAHREALSKALKAFHAKKGKGKRKSSVKRKTSAKAPVRRKRTVGSSRRSVNPFKKKKRNLAAYRNSANSGLRRRRMY